MRRHFRFLLLTGLMWAGSIVAQPTPAWWDNFPRIVNFINQTCGTQAAAKAIALNADAGNCNSAEDTTAGIWSQRITILEESEPQAFISMHSAGLKSQTYFPSFGYADAYVVQVKKNPDGTFVKDQTDPQLTRRFANWWGWGTFDGTGEVHWVFGNEAFSQPYTLTHPRYGSPPMKYPDGTIASGYHGAAMDPRNSLVYDACGAKDVMGNLAYDYYLSPGVPQTGFAQVGSQFVGLFQFNKDSACPSWIDYARAATL